MGLTAHVGRTLNIVLSAQWVYADARTTNISGDHRQIGDQHHRIGSVGVFGDSESMKRHGIGCRGIGDCCFLHQLFVHSAYLFLFIRVQSKQMFFEFLKSFCP